MDEEEYMDYCAQVFGAENLSDRPVYEQLCDEYGHIEGCYRVVPAGEVE